MEYNKYKIVGMRFLRGTLSGAISSMIVVVGSVSYTQGVTTFLDVQQMLYALSVSGIIGALSGGILALDKAIRSE